MKKYKSGNEFLPYHASASHPPPDFRDGWNACFAEAEIRITELQAQLAGAEAEITAIKQGLHRASFDNESLKKDAERYQWLRSQHCDKSYICVVSLPKSSVRLGSECPSLKRLDEIIDASIAEGKQA